ncbi:DUF3576 domain-containing protein [Pseudemcibacter aquimaris]|uniref:DUF3576 domain-containing protein n=1 Tax=Pseudemcibacter aquimaris TaxID=2857064 RepID=UPI00201291C6|nr:DUF3576 domain-containing protein [Pseudemcibacter aquimaris]MCC3861983.1 DUF3576 domain-containing protein [Pseudemcibacter aquimaris]WDU58735.1 DUF3576 domain-containing protein [Pseudemcibacter aquimaris]
MNKLQEVSMKSLATILMIFSTILVSGCDTRSEIGEPRMNITAAEEVYTIGVNAYIWRAALDTLSFMPLVSAEPTSGIIITDWKVNPSDANERTKVDVYIVGSELRADSMNVTVHRETMQNGNWVSVEPRPNAASQIVQAITIQARLLRRDNAPVTSF